MFHILRLVLLVFPLCLTACSSFYPPWNAPRDYPLNYATLSEKKPSVITMTDELRTVIIVPGAVSGVNADLRICPEPPADAADNIASSIASSVKASDTNPQQTLEAEAEFSKVSSSAIASILNRSQGLELFRDGSNALCLAWINDVYNRSDLDAWRKDFRYLLKISYLLIDREISSPKSKSPGIEEPDLSEWATNTYHSF